MSIQQDGSGHTPKAEELARTLATLFDPEDVIEMRAIKGRVSTPKRYSDRERLITSALKYNERGYEVYVVMNKLYPDVEERIKERGGSGTTDEDIERRRWLLVDADAKRESDTSSTDEEKATSRETALAIYEFLRALGWSEPLFNDSGNGYHLLYPIDLPADAVSLALVGDVLGALNARFEDEHVKIDQAVKNAGRITKLYGVMTHKGEDTPERPHRQSMILQAPDTFKPVSIERLEEIAALNPARRAIAPRMDRPAASGGDIEESIAWVERFIARHEIPLGKNAPGLDGGYVWEIDLPCPLNGHYGTGEYWIGVNKSGQIVGGCHHDSCKTEGFNWHDIREHYEPGHKANKAKYEAEAAPSDDGKAQGGKSRDGNQAKRLIRYATEDASELFLDQNGTEHALVDGAPLPLDRGCYGWLRRLFWKHEETAATTDLLGTVAGQLRAFAETSGNEHTLHLRAAWHEGAVYLYLGPGRVVRCDARGWELDPNPPVMFRRVANQKELPNPARGGSLDLLDEFITAQEDRDHRLAKAWLVLALLADINRPILLAHGPQGATKSSVQRVLKNIIDPARPTTLKLREKDFEQNINKAFIPFFDNVSTITDHMADELSKAVTGAGNAQRKLYEDDEDVIREYKRAMLLNGLIIPTDKADLIDRTLPVALKRVPKEERKTERRMQALFDEHHPKLLGAVLDALSGAFSYHEEVEGLPRLADWAEYAIALYKHLDWGGKKGFLADWAVIEEGQYETTLDSSVLAQCVVAMMKEHDVVDDSPTGVLKLLKQAASSEGIDTDGKGNDFPASASWVWRRLVPIVPTLEAFRIKVEEGTRGSGKDKMRFIRLSLDDGGDSKPPSADSKTKMLSAEKPHRNGAGTAGDSRTAYLPKNSKYTEGRIDQRPEEGVLQGGKNAVPAVPAVPEAYLSGKSADSISDDAVPTDESAVPPDPTQDFDEETYGKLVVEFMNEGVSEQYAEEAARAKLNAKKDEAAEPRAELQGDPEGVIDQTVFEALMEVGGGCPIRIDRWREAAEYAGIPRDTFKASAERLVIAKRVAASEGFDWYPVMDRDAEGDGETMIF